MPSLRVVLLPEFLLQQSTASLGGDAEEDERTCHDRNEDDPNPGDQDDVHESGE